MKSIKFISALFLCGLLFTALSPFTKADAAAGKQIIVDTKFDQTDKDNKLLVMPAKAEEPQLPITIPSSVSFRGSLTVKGASEEIAGVKAPYAIFKGTEGPNTGGEIYWDLRNLMLKSGKYTLSCQVAPQDANVDGLHMQVVMAGEDGAWIWPQRRPACITFDKGAITTDEPGSEKIAYTVGATVTLLVEFDMDALTWGASADGKAILPSTSFKQLFNPGSGLMVGGIFLRDSCKNVVASNMKLEKLAEKSAPSPERVATEKITRIAWVGDSITQGYGLSGSDKKSPPGVLRRLLDGKAMVGNFGISGTTLLKNGDSSYWKQNALFMAKHYSPNVVIIMLGTNDSKPQNWAHSTEIAGDMAAMINIFKDLPSKPEVIVVMPVPVFKPAFGITEELLVQVRPLLAQGAKQAGATIIESAETFAGQEALFADGVHPNEKGAEMIGQLVLKSLPAKKE
ncbi:MAG: GDSL-type esterase/lipase family protein [bacterium]